MVVVKCSSMVRCQRRRKFASANYRGEDPPHFGGGGGSAAGCVVGDRDHAHPPGRPGHGRLPRQNLRRALDSAVRCGNDTDTVAAIAGGLLGATYGASAVPAE